MVTDTPTSEQPSELAMKLATSLWHWHCNNAMETARRISTAGLADLEATLKKRDELVAFYCDSEVPLWIKRRDNLESKFAATKAELDEAQGRLERIEKVVEVENWAQDERGSLAQHIHRLATADKEKRDAE